MKVLILILLLVLAGYGEDKVILPEDNSDNYIYSSTVDELYVTNYIDYISTETVKITGVIHFSVTLQSYTTHYRPFDACYRIPEYKPKNLYEFTIQELINAGALIITQEKKIK